MIATPPHTSLYQNTRRFIAYSFLSILINGQLIAAPTLPDAATPGGALPRLAEKLKAISDDSDRLLIPKVIDRPLNVDEGDRVKVKEFVIKGVISHPAYGIRKEDVAFIAEANRVSRQRLDEADMEGFTPEEVDDIAEFVRQLVEEPNQRPTSANLWKLVFKLRQSEWNRGLTMGQMQEIADEITRYYRQHGLILATAFIPAQDVVEGKVIIEILEGKLGRVITEGNLLYSRKIISRPFENLINKAVHKNAIETGLLHLSDYPGMIASGIFRPAKEQGKTDLLIKMLDEQRFNAAFLLDNNGSEFTGKYRSRIDVSVNNLTGGADQLNLSILQSFSPTNGTFGTVSYSYPIMSSDWQLGSSFAHNQFSVDKLAAKISGTSDIVSGYIKKIFQRNRRFNSYALAELSRKSTGITFEASDESNDEYDVGRLEAGFDFIDTRFAGINVAALQFHQGLGTRIGAAGFEDTNSLEGGFQKANANFSRLQTIVQNFSLLLTTQMQFSEQRLHSLEQMSLGGVDSVRAYPISEYLRDVGYFGSAELILNAPGFANKPAFAGRRWGEIFSISAFFDVGGGWLRKSTDAEIKEVHIKGAGLGVKFNLPEKLLLRLQFATVVDNTNAIDGSANRFYFDFAYFY